MHRIASTVAITALLLLFGRANAAGPQDVKEGLWSIHRQVIDNPGNNRTESTQTLCRNHAYDQHVQEEAKKVKGCTTVKDVVEGGRHFTESHCVVGPTTMDTRGAATFQGDTAAHNESTTKYTPALNGVSETTMIMDQKYVGSCPAGVEPGDMTNAAGRITHLWKH